MLRKAVLFLIFFNLVLSYAQSDNTLMPLLSQSKNSAFFDSVILQKSNYHLQIIYTQIDRGAANQPILKNYYLTPAAYYNFGENTWTLPLAILAFEKINSLNKNRVSIYDTLVVTQDYCPQTQEDFKKTIAQLIKEMLLTNDSKAFNALVDFVTPEYANNRMKELGYPSAILLKKNSPCDDLPVANTNKVMLIGKDVVKFQQNKTRNLTDWKYIGNLKPLVGKAFAGNAIIIKKPKDFSSYNYLSIIDLQDMLTSIIFPQLQKVDKKLQLSSTDIAYIRKFIAMQPAESNSPVYDPTVFPDTYKKYYINNTSSKKIPDNIRAYSISGKAFGFVTDCSYFTDTLNKIEFMLTTSLYVNNSDLLKEENYQYTTAAFPFLEELFNTIYIIELNRKRPHTPIFEDDNFDDKKSVISKAEKIKRGQVSATNTTLSKLQKLYLLATDTSGIEAEQEIANSRHAFNEELIKAYLDTSAHFSLGNADFATEKTSDDKLCKTVVYHFDNSGATVSQVFVTLPTKEIVNATLLFEPFQQIAIEKITSVYNKFYNSYIITASGENSEQKPYQLCAFINVEKDKITAANNFIKYKKTKNYLAVPNDAAHKYPIKIHAKKSELQLPQYIAGKKKPIWQKFYLAEGIFTDTKQKNKN